MSTETLNVVGKSKLRRDGLGHVTGKTIYVNDMSFPDMLTLKMVRSPVPHANLKGIDFSEAEKSQDSYVPSLMRMFPKISIPF